jgi:hypothetical protein
MAIVDDRGRVGGRVNLIDAVAAFLILILIPVAFGAYLLFRTPMPRLTAISPETLYQGPNLRIEVQGENLRPFMRVSFNDQQGRSYAINSTRGAIVELPDLGAGMYDIVLYDHMQEVSRLRKALTILPLASVQTVEMEVAGAFKGLSADRIRTLKAGDTIAAGNSVAHVVSIGAPVPSTVKLRVGNEMVRVLLKDHTDVPAVLKVTCFVVTTDDGALKCVVPGPLQQSDVAPGAVLSLASPGGWVTYQIDEVHK